MKKISIYTDGACSYNPGPGGWGAVMMYNGVVKAISGGEEMTTNNRMEIMAVIKALSTLKEVCEVDLYSDSAYVVNAVTEGWLESWKANGWRKKKEPLKNVELWQTLESLLRHHKVKFIKVKGHSDNVYNNECDKLARAEVDKILRIKQE